MNKLLYAMIMFFGTIILILCWEMYDTYLEKNKLKEKNITKAIKWLTIFACCKLLIFISFYTLGIF